MNCPKCKNKMKEIFKPFYMGMGRYKNKPSGEYECPYCVWKGDAGPGALMKDILGNKVSKKAARYAVSVAYAKYCEDNPESTQDERKAEFQRLYNRIVEAK